MRRVALKGLAWRKIRGVLTSLAIVLGVAMVSGAFILTDTMKKAADNLEASSYAGIDGIVTGVASFRDDNSWQKTPSIPSRYVAKVDRVPQVGDAVGTILDQAKLVDDKGEVIGSRRTSRRHRREPAGADRLNPLTLGSGRWASGPARSRSTPGTARRQHLGIGDTVGVVATGPRAHVHDRRARQVRERRLARRGDGRRVRPEDGSALFDKQARSTRSRREQAGASRAVTRARSLTRLRHADEGADGRGGRPVRLQGSQELRHLHQDLPARVRRHRALRRRVHHLQHVRDHRRATHA
jgi:hypothetical protein